MHRGVLAVIVLVALYGDLGGGAGSNDMDEVGSSSSSRTVLGCLKRNNAKILRELHNMTDHIKVSIPDKIRHQRLLPKSLTGIAFLKEILDFYAKDVFGKVSPGDRMLTNLYRLRKNVEVCARNVSNSLTPMQQKIIESIKLNFTELKADGPSKAVGEFNTVLLCLEDHLYPRCEASPMKKRCGCPSALLLR